MGEYHITLVTPTRHIKTFTNISDYCTIQRNMIACLLSSSSNKSLQCYKSRVIHMLLRLFELALKRFDELSFVLLLQFMWKKFLLPLLIAFLDNGQHWSFIVGFCVSAGQNTHFTRSFFKSIWVSLLELLYILHNFKVTTPTSPELSFQVLFYCNMST